MYVPNPNDLIKAFYVPHERGNGWRKQLILLCIFQETHSIVCEREGFIKCGEIIFFLKMNLNQKW